MANPLSPAVLRAFREEVELLNKSAGAADVVWRGLKNLGRASVGGGKGILHGGKEVAESILGSPKQWQEGAGRLIQPIKGITKGVSELSPAEHLKTLEPGAKEKYLKGMFWNAGEHMRGPKVLRKENLSDIMKGTTEGAMEGGKTKALAEELSRRGWTGMGRATKYLPLGQKSMFAGFSYPAVQSVMEARKAKQGPTMEHGVAEEGLGELAGTGGFLAAGSLGVAPGLAMYLATRGIGSRMGRVIDRLRSGANLRTALYAPTQEQAMEQLENIQRYYS